MRWVVVDVVVALLAVGVLALAALSLWHRVTALGRATAAAGALLDQAAAQLEQAGASPTATPGRDDVVSATSS